MAHDSKQGFLSSLFGKKKKNEDEEIAQIALKQKLEERIRQVLADTVEAPELLTLEATPVAVPIAQQAQQTLVNEQKEPAEPVDLLPISASVISGRKAPVQAGFLLSSFEVPRKYAANER